MAGCRGSSGAKPNAAVLACTPPSRHPLAAVLGSDGQLPNFMNFIIYIYFYERLYRFIFWTNLDVTFIQNRPFFLNELMSVFEHPMDDSDDELWMRIVHFVILTYKKYAYNLP